MLRLASRILSSQLPAVMCGLKRTDPRYEEAKEYVLSLYDSAKACVSDSTCVIADNVASYFYEHYPIGIDIDFASFPHCVPFRDEMFIEWTLPGTERLTQLGFFLDTTDTQKDGIPPRMAKILKETKDYGDFRWFCYGTGYVCHAGNIMFPNAALAWTLDNDGNSNGQLFSAPLSGYKESEEEEEALDSLISHGLPVLLLTLSLANCKNVKSEDITDSAGPTDKWNRRMKCPKIRYHVLNINPMKEVLRRDGNAAVNGIPKAMHIVRGHFAEYTDERPLFGRIVGRFWKPSHVRGNAENGIVDKDYSISKPVIAPAE